MKETKSYTATDIERYHRGELSAAEMHDLEAAALADPFLADALEGYTFTQTPAADRAVLQQRLQQRIQQKDDRKAAVWMNTAWMRVAALIILVAGGGWLAVKLFNQSDASIAGVAPAKPESVAASPIIDSTAVVYNTPPTPGVNADRESDAASSAQTRPGALAPQPPRQVAPATSSASTITDTSYASIAGEVEAARGRLNEVTVSAPTARKEDKAAFSKQAQRDSITNLNVVLKPNNLPVDQVTVSRSKRAASAHDYRRRGNVVIDSLEPAEGWTRYDDYVASNIKEPENFKEKQLHGEVVLSFDVNTEGEPVNIAVVKSLCAKCDKEAIRLLKEGPKWKQANGKGQIKIAF